MNTRHVAPAAVLLAGILFTIGVATAQQAVIIGTDSITDAGHPPLRAVAVDSQGRIITAPLSATACGPTTTQTVKQMDGGSQTMGSLYNGGGHPTSQYIIVCNSKDSTGGGLIRCRQDGVAPIIDAGAPGTVLDVGDCVPYSSNVAGPVVRCIGGSNLVSIYECGP